MPLELLLAIGGELEATLVVSEDTRAAQAMLLLITVVGGTTLECREDMLLVWWLELYTTSGLNVDRKSIPENKIVKKSMHNIGK